jgi:PKD repeat protein
MTRGDALGVNGSILRIDPESGDAASGNPLAGIRQIAFGLRNPFRIGFRPGTRELWIGDVGEDVREEVNRVADVTDAIIENFGWPCYEGADPHPGYAGQPSCVALINDRLPPGTPGTKTSPVFSYVHGEAPGHDLIPDGCQNGASQAISGIAFYRGGNYPSQYQHALFFSDYGVNCIYAMRADADGVPDPTQIDVVERAAEIPVSLEVGPGGDIFYASIAGAIRRITYGAELTAKATADPTSGAAPLTVQFDGSRSLDTLGGTLEYAWDLDGDGAFDDSTLVRPQRTYTRGLYSVRLQVTNRNHKTAVSAPIVIAAGERPVATITAPASGHPWKAGQRISFAGTATDDQDGALPPQAMSWRITLLHCPLGGCHPHPVGTFDGVDGGSFVTAPDGYPAYYDIELAATDSSGLTGKTTVRIDAIGTELTFQTTPSGLPLLYAGNPVLTPTQVTEVASAEVSVEAPSPVEVGGASYVFTGWSDGGARAHILAVPDNNTTYIATYELDADRDGLADSMGGNRSGCSCAAGGTTPGVGALVVFGFVLLVGLGRNQLAAHPRRVGP